MADVGVDFTATITDGLLTPAKVAAYLSVPDSTSLATLIAELDTWAGAIDACVDGALSDVRAAVIPLSPPAGLKGPTGATWLASRVEQTGILNFSATGSDRRYGQALPSVRNTAIVSGKLNLSDAQIAALITLLTNPANLYTNRALQQLEAALDAFISFRQRAYLAKTSFEI